MIEHRPFASLGNTEVPGLTGRHHFCFARYQHPERLEWDRLRIWNDCVLDAGAGRPPEHCDNFDIVTLVLAGSLHRPGSFGDHCRTGPGFVQILSTGAGSSVGLRADDDGAVSFHEIWLRSDRAYATPRCTTVRIGERDGWQLLGSGVSDEDSVPLTSRCRLLFGRLSPGITLARETAGASHAYLVPVRGSVEVNGETLDQGSGAALAGEERISLRTGGAADIVLVESGFA
ncbi:MAG: pirin family protein [Allosphingosinicella sp.]